MPLTQKCSLKVTMMPHVASQLQPEQLTRKPQDEKAALETPKESFDYLMPMPLSPRQRTPGRLRATPSLSQLATEGNSKWDKAFARHVRDFSRDANTPISAVDSIFELPSGSMDSPNSSIHSSFIAELEDTSPFALQSKRHTPPTHPRPQAHLSPPPAAMDFMEFKSSELTARAVIKVVDETIANIEAANRELLYRAEAAEEAARILREQNSTLQQRIEEYNRPKTAPSQPPPRMAGLRHKPSPSVSTPLSAFNANIDQLVLNASSAQKTLEPPLYPLHTRQFSSVSSRSNFQSSAIDDPFTTPKMATSPRQRLPPLPLLPAHEISSPIPGSVMRHEVTYDGVPISLAERRARNISLEEARRREKPLPPLGPMSPSVLRGVVEIGTPKGVDEFGREIKMSIETRDEDKRRRGFSGLFRRRAKDRMF